MFKLKEKRPKATEKGKFVISLDFELFWGVHDVFSKDAYATNIYGAHRAVPAILKLFHHYGIQATWAVVGLLYLNNMREFNANIPVETPDYAQKRLSPYYYAARNQIQKEEYELYFAPGLISSIAKTPGQEIGSHTFSHYYCLEKGQTLDTFVADVEMFFKVSRGRMQSIVFPRNQINKDYLDICREFGFIAYRGNERGWVYRIRRNDRRNWIKRGLRFIDMYVNLFGHQTYSLPQTERDSLVNIPASRQLKPVSNSFKWLERRRLSRILNAMTHAAKKGEIYHLWWHPHNFGVLLEENLAFLEKILKHYQLLNTLYGFQSMNMGGLTAEPGNDQHVEGNNLQGVLR